MENIFPTIVDNTSGLANMLRTAMGEPSNLCNINPNITPEGFKLSRSGVWEICLELAPYLDWETQEKAAERLISLGYTLENTGELTAFLTDKPDEVEKYSMVSALGEDSRWMDLDGYVHTPYASVERKVRCFRLYRFDRHLFSNCRVLVSRQARSFVWPLCV